MCRTPPAARQSWRRNTPARVPCTSILSHSLGFTAKEDIGVMANSLCVLNGLFNGFGGLPP